MRKFLALGILLTTPVLYAQNVYLQDQKSAQKLMEQCVKPASKRPGSQESKECLEGMALWQTTSDRLLKDVSNNINKGDEDRRRVQQEERWREEVRRK